MKMPPVGPEGGAFFFQPSDQGFELSIRERVARFREARLEAMIEPDISNPLSIEAGPAAEKTSDESSGGWLERTLGSRGEQLGRIRERLLELACISRQSLVLDLQGRTGLLAFEACRRAPEGGVWVLAHDDRAFATLQSLAKTLSTLAQPQIIRTDFSRFDRDLAVAAGAKVRFNAIVGRNVLTYERNKKALIERVLAFLHPDGVAACAEVVPSEGQRISNLTESWKMDPDLKTILSDAETALFSDKNDPLVSFTSATLGNEIAAIPGVTVVTTVQNDSPGRRISPQEIDFWFRISDRKGRLSLGDRVLALADLEKYTALKTFLHRKLDYQEVCWKTVTLFIKLFKIKK